MNYRIKAGIISFLSFISLISCESEDELTLADKLNKTVWEAIDHQPSDYGFFPIVGFSGAKIFELTDFAGTSPIGCFPYNESVRSRGFEVKNLEVGAEKISFRIVKGQNSSLIEIFLYLIVSIFQDGQKCSI